MRGDLERFDDVHVLSELVAELYRGDDKSYLRVGELSAEWALAEGGPYHHLVKDRDVPAFARSAPNIYKNYFTAGAAEAEVDPKNPKRVSLALGEDARVTGASGRASSAGNSTQKSEPLP